MKIICRFLEQEHGDLYFLLHNYCALIILFTLKKKLKEICWSMLKDIAESVQKSLVDHANYDLQTKERFKSLSFERV